MKVLDLFSGIGAFSLGLERAGMETIAFCEIDKKCCRILKRVWPDVPIFGDIKTLTNIQADVICGGFPCQDISVAGRAKGITEHTRSGLWFEFKRIIAEVEPQYVIIENVERLRCKGLAVVLKDLWSIGYDAEWHIIPASAIGAPHKRERIWIIAYPCGNHSSGILDKKHVVQDHEQWQFPKGFVKSWHGWQYWFAKDVFACDRTEDAPQDTGMDDGAARRVDRVKQLGNSLVPQIPTLIGKAILEAQ